MTLPAPAARRSGVGFRLFGFPVHVDLSFVVVMALLGYGAAASVGRIVLWVLLGLVSVLAHELGHAFVARTTGARPVIDLYSFGGLTSFSPARPMSRLRSVSVSLAGPAVGIAIGLVLLFAVPASQLEPGSTAAYAREAAVFVNLGWGLLNLLPVLPLDGGQALVEALPGDPATRRRRAALVSIPVAVAVGIVALRLGNIFGALLAGWFAAGNIRTATARPGRDDAPGASLPPSRPATTADRDVLWLLDQGRVDQARHLLTTLPDQSMVDVSVRGLLLVASGRVEQGRPLVRHAYAAAPGDPLRAAALVRLLIADRDWPGLVELLRQESGTAVPVELATAAQSAAFRAGAFRGSAAIGEAVLPRAGEHGALVACNIACAYSRAGDPERALAALRAAVQLGWTDGPALDGDDDLAPVRDLPGYRDLRAGLG